MDGLVQSARPQYQQKPRSFPVQVLDALELVGRVTADVIISIVLGIVMVVEGFGYSQAVLLSAVILFVLLGLSLLDGWFTIVLAAILLALSVAAGTIFHSITIFWLAVVYMIFLTVVVVSIHKRRHR